MSARFPFQSVRAGHRTNQNKGITMKSQGLIIAGACALMIAGCTNNPYTGEQQAGKSAVYGGIGALTGAAIGAATSSSDDRAKGALIGAAVVGAAGGGYGYYVDKQEQRLRQCWLAPACRSSVTATHCSWSCRATLPLPPALPTSPAASIRR